MLGRELLATVVVALFAASCASQGATAVADLPSPASPPAASAGPSTPARGASAQGERRPQRDLAALLASGGDESSWAAAPAGSSSLLSATASDGGVLLETRGHAVEGLAWIPDPEATGALRALIADANGDPVVRAAAVASLARRLGRAAVPELQALLTVPEPNVRAAAVRALGVVGGAEAQTALETRLEAEESQELREAIQMSLTQMQP